MTTQAKLSLVTEILPTFQPASLNRDGWGLGFYGTLSKHTAAIACLEFE